VPQIGSKGVGGVLVIMPPKKKDAGASKKVAPDRSEEQKNQMTTMYQQVQRRVNPALVPLVISGLSHCFWPVQTAGARQNKRFGHAGERSGEPEL